MENEALNSNSICDSYLKTIGYQRVQGDTLEPIFPVLIMDMNYQIFNKVVRPINCKNELKMWKNKWLQSFRCFNKQFFGALSEEQVDKTINLMDDFDEYIKDDVFRAKIQMMNLLDDLELDEQEICSDLIIANVFAQIACLVWSHCFKTAMSQDSENPYLKSAERASCMFMKIYHSSISKRDVNPNKDKKASEAISVLCRKSIRYLYKDVRPERMPNIHVKEEK